MSWSFFAAMAGMSRFCCFVRFLTSFPRQLSRHLQPFRSQYICTYIERLETTTKASEGECRRRSACGPPSVVRGGDEAEGVFNGF